MKKPLHTRADFQSTKIVPAALACLSLVLLAGCQPRDPGHADDKPAGGLVVPRQQQADRLNAYVEAYNRLFDRGRFDEKLEEYRKDNPGVQGKGKLTAYRFHGSDLDDIIERFDEVLAEKGTDELDVRAQALRAALTTLSPLYKEASAYSTNKEYLTDGGAKARQLDAPLQAAMQAADDATSAFEQALSAATLKRNQEQLATLKPGTVAYHRLKTMLAVKALGPAVRAANNDRAKLPEFDSAIEAVAQANAELGTMKRDPSAQPAWDPVCKIYKDRVDRVLGSAREVSASLHDGKRSNLNDQLERLSKARNDSVSKANDCGS